MHSLSSSICSNLESATRHDSILRAFEITFSKYVVFLKKLTRKYMLLRKNRNPNSLLQKWCLLLYDFLCLILIYAVLKTSFFRIIKKMKVHFSLRQFKLIKPVLQNKIPQIEYTKTSKNSKSNFPAKTKEPIKMLHFVRPLTWTSLPYYKEFVFRQYSRQTSKQENKQNII